MLLSLGLPSPARLSPSVLLLASVLLLIPVPDCAAQERWSWPEKTKNLEVLPADTSARELAEAMRGFASALGVRCSFCHVGQDDRPLSTFDFVSDENPKKQTARLMMKLLQEVDTRLEAIEPSGPRRVSMGCNTCHRGQPRPLTLEDMFREALERDGVEAAVAHYRELRESSDGRGSFDFGERSFIRLGYGFLGEGNMEAAIAVFRLATEAFPASGNTWDSLAEAYMKSGQREVADVFYRKSLEIDPENANAVAKLRELQKATPTPAPSP